MSHEEISKGMRFVLEKMCTYVDANLDEIDLHEDGWYQQYEWSKEDEEDFTQWLVDKFRNNNNVRKDVTTLPYRPTIARAEMAASWFILYCGWKTKQENDG